MKLHTFVILVMNRQILGICSGVISSHYTKPKLHTYIPGLVSWLFDWFIGWFLLFWVGMDWVGVVYFSLGLFALVWVGVVRFESEFPLWFSDVREVVCVSVLQFVIPLQPVDASADSSLQSNWCSSLWQSNRYGTLRTRYRNKWQQFI